MSSHSGFDDGLRGRLMVVEREPLTHQNFRKLMPRSGFWREPPTRHVRDRTYSFVGPIGLAGD